MLIGSSTPQRSSVAPRSDRSGRRGISDGAPSIGGVLSVVRAASGGDSARHSCDTSGNGGFCPGAPACEATVLAGMLRHEVLVYHLQSTVLLVAADAMGVRFSPAAILGLLGLLPLPDFGLVSISYGPAMVIRDEGGPAAVLNTVILPLRLPSGASVPLPIAPKAIALAARSNPFGYAMDAARNLAHGSSASAVWSWYSAHRVR